MAKQSNRHDRDSGSHVLLEFPNGVRASIIDDGYGSPTAPYEVLLEDASGRGLDLGVAAPSGDGKGIYGWLNEKQLGELLAAAAKLGG